TRGDLADEDLDPTSEPELLTPSHPGELVYALGLHFEDPSTLLCLTQKSSTPDSTSYPICGAFSGTNVDFTEKNQSNTVSEQYTDLLQKPNC
ncbi:Hypothetical predicted protein, partial [Lynx pardinus]